MKKSLKADPVKCVACRLCELACVMGREKVYNPKRARITVNLVGIPELPAPVFTRLCDTCGGNPRCAAICPVDAITYEADNPRPDQKTIPDHEKIVTDWVDQFMPKQTEEKKKET
jgi:Fe-S-cluster-containing hydrogenase component 2